MIYVTLLVGDPLHTDEFSYHWIVDSSTLDRLGYTNIPLGIYIIKRYTEEYLIQRIGDLKKALADVKLYYLCVV